MGCSDTRRVDSVRKRRTHLHNIHTLLALCLGHLETQMLEVALQSSSLALDDDMACLEIHGHAFGDDHLLGVVDGAHHVFATRDSKKATFPLKKRPLQLFEESLKPASENLKK